MAFTYFFRDMQTLDAIKDYALPQLKTRRYIRIWDAGCAMGQEPYSLAIVLRENMGHMYFRNVKIYATDIDSSNLFEKIICEGNYPKEQIDRIPKDILCKYFSVLDNGKKYTINDEIKKSLQYIRHDLLSLKPVVSGVGLVLCKNVLLHFEYHQRVNVLKMFHDVLDDGGFLAMEHTQKLPAELEEYFERVVPNIQLYRKVGKVESWKAEKG